MMESTTLCIHEYLSTYTRRCIDRVILLFSLNNQLDVVVNGKHESVGSNLIVINHSDLYQITNAEQLVELIIPVQQFAEIDQSFFHCYYNFKLINSSEYIKYLTLTMIEQLSRLNDTKSSNIIEIITILNKEAKIKQDFIYVPSIQSESNLLNKITVFIKAHVTQPIFSKDISNSFYISAPYISILFKKYLGISFKHYIASLKIAASLAELVHSKETIHAISENMGFNHYPNYTHQFKNHLNMTPNEYRKKFMVLQRIPVKLINEDVSNYIPYFESISVEKPLPSNQVNIELDQLTYKDIAKTPTLFIHIDDLMDIVQSTLNTNLNFTDLSETYLMINNVSKLALEKLNFTGLIDFIDSLFSNNVGIAIRVKSSHQFKFIQDIILQYSKYKNEHHYQQSNSNFIMLFDAEHLSLKEINRLYIKLKNLNIRIKLAITVEGVIKQTHSLKSAFDILHRFNFDFYFIDIEQKEVQSLLNKKSNMFNHSMSYFDYYNQLIDASQIHTSKFVYTKLTKKCFKLYKENTPLETADLICHILIMLNRGSGVGYELMSKDNMDIALMNRHGICEPLIYLYQIVKPFIGKPLSIHENYIVFKDFQYIHILLFNSLKHRFSPQEVHKFVLRPHVLPTKAMLFIQTLNREHGFIDYALPPLLNETYIERTFLRHIEQANTPKAEIKQFIRTANPLEFELHYDELKYIRISPF